MHVGKRKGKKERKHKVRHVANVKRMSKQLCLPVLYKDVFRPGLYPDSDITFGDYKTAVRARVFCVWLSNLYIYLLLIIKSLLQCSLPAVSFTTQVSSKSAMHKMWRDKDAWACQSCGRCCVRSVKIKSALFFLSYYFNWFQKCRIRILNTRKNNIDDNRKMQLVICHCKYKIVK